MFLVFFSFHNYFPQLYFFDFFFDSNLFTNLEKLNTYFVLSKTRVFKNRLSFYVF